RSTAKNLREAETTLSDIETKIARNDQRLTSGAVTTPKDIAAVEHELTYLREQKGQIEERVLLAMDALEAAKATAQRDTERLAEAERDRAIERTRQQTLLTTAQETQATLTPQRAGAAAQIAPAALTKYEALRKTKGRAVAVAQNGTCLGCRVAIQPA